MIELFAVIALSLVTIGLGIFVLTNNHSEVRNRILFILSLTVATWTMSNYFSNDVSIEYNLALLVNQFVLAAALMTAALLPVFLLSFYQTQKTRVISVAILVFSTMLGILSFTPLIATGIVQTEPVTEIEFGNLAIFYFLALIASVIGSIYIALKLRKKLDRSVLPRFAVVTYSAISSYALLFITNGLLPSLFGYFELTRYGIGSLAIMIAGFAYAIVRHRLFDPRVAAVRATTYFLSLGAVLLLVIGAIFQTAQTSLNEFSENNPVISQVILTIIILLIFPAFVRIFQRMTERVFLQQKYQPGDVLDSITQTTQNSVNLEHILKTAATDISQALKAKQCILYISSDGVEALQSTSSIPETVKRVLTDIQQIPETSYVNESELEHKNVLQKHEIDLITPLKLEGENIGLMLIGRSDATANYYSNDIEFIESLAPVIALGVSNSIKVRKLELFNEELDQKIKQATKDLRSKNNKLRTLDKNRETFMSLTSHQLKPNLGAVMGYIELLKSRNTELDNDSTELINSALEGANRMEDVIKSLLDSPRNHEGRIQLEKGDFDIVSLIQSEIDRITEIYKRTITLTTSHGKLQLSVDKNKLMEAVANIIHNAVQYSPMDSTVDIEIKKTSDDSADIIIRDTGVGISAADKKTSSRNSVGQRMPRNSAQLAPASGFSMHAKLSQLTTAR